MSVCMMKKEREKMKVEKKKKNTKVVGEPRNNIKRRIRRQEEKMLIRKSIHTQYSMVYIRAFRKKTHLLSSTLSICTLRVEACTDCLRTPEANQTYKPGSPVEVSHEVCASTREHFTESVVRHVAKQ